MHDSIVKATDAGHSYIDHNNSNGAINRIWITNIKSVKKKVVYLNPLRRAMFFFISCLNGVFGLTLLTSGSWFGFFNTGLALLFLRELIYDKYVIFRLEILTDDSSIYSFIGPEDLVTTEIKLIKNLMRKNNR